MIKSILKLARGEGFEPTSSCEHEISNLTPYRARRPPLKLIEFRWLISITWKCDEMNILRKVIRLQI